MEANEFTVAETVVFARALKWFDQSDALEREAEGLSGREKDAKLKAAEDAGTTGLRFWKTLKFTDAAKPTRRPGRPSGRRLPMPNMALTIGGGHHADGAR